jgi:hypothetical protein
MELTSKCFELDANYDKDSVAGKALRQQVLGWPLQDLSLGDEFNRVLGSHFGEVDPGMVTVRRMLNVLTAYANSRRKNINKEKVKHTVHPLWNKLPIYFDRNGNKLFYDDDVPDGMEMFMIVQLVESAVPQSDPARFEASLQNSPKPTTRLKPRKARSGLTCPRSTSAQRKARIGPLAYFSGCIRAKMSRRTASWYGIGRSAT